MSEDTRISGRVDIEPDSKYRIAYDLMHLIAAKEQKDEQAPRKYWMTLYSQCISTVQGYLPTDIEERPKR